MKTLNEKCKAVVIAIGSVTCLIVITTEPVNAQGINPRAIGAVRRSERMQRRNDPYERDKLERQLANGPEHSRLRKNEADAIQAKQDFVKIQTNYNRIVLAMASKESIQRRTVLADVAEIKKAAARLKTKLALPIAADVEQKAEQPVVPDFFESLLKLQLHIYDFLTSPLFDSPPAYKVEAAKKASSDLDRIIKVSEAIGKSGVR
ncbi:MAG TPA: hypothetical protein VJV03_05625 [Pyrinomonadaceae bacterium]|nr:hypothetical protein [Pyrinomonadaceae bacterium]